MLMMTKHNFMFVYNAVSINYVSFTANSCKFSFIPLYSYIGPIDIVN